MWKSDRIKTTLKVSCAAYCGMWVWSRTFGRFDDVEVAHYWHFRGGEYAIKTPQLRGMNNKKKKACLDWEQQIIAQKWNIFAPVASFRAYYAFEKARYESWHLRNHVFPWTSGVFEATPENIEIMHSIEKFPIAYKCSGYYNWRGEGVVTKFEPIYCHGKDIEVWDHGNYCDFTSLRKGITRFPDPWGLHKQTTAIPLVLWDFRFNVPNYDDGPDDGGYGGGGSNGGWGSKAYR